jgi:hypothetical protein
MKPRACTKELGFPEGSCYTKFSLEVSAQKKRAPPHLYRDAEAIHSNVFVKSVLARLPEVVFIGPQFFIANSIHFSRMETNVMTVPQGGEKEQDAGDSTA